MKHFCLLLVAVFAQFNLHIESDTSRSVTVGFDGITTSLSSFCIYNTNFLNFETFLFSSVLFWGSAVLSPTRSPTRAILPTRISRRTYITVPAYRTANTHADTTFSFSRSDGTRWWVPAEFYRTLLSHSCLIPLYSPTRPPTHPLCLFPSHSSAFSLVLAVSWVTRWAVEANYSSAVSVSGLYKIRALSAEDKHLKVSLHLFRCLDNLACLSTFAPHTSVWIVLWIYHNEMWLSLRDGEAQTKSDVKASQESWGITVAQANRTFA